MTATVSNDGSSVSIERPALYVIATPIGNLADISARALQVLAAVDLILVEDKRVSIKLLQNYGIATEMRALHDHNEKRRAEAVVSAAKAQNLAVAQISDAGTPLISDPGYSLVNAAITNSLTVLAVPGPCAAITALSISGLPTNEFTFIGFLSAKMTAKARELEALSTEHRTLIFYESPHRITDTLTALQSAFGTERQAVVARELTKRFETVYRGTLQELLMAAETEPNFSRGEIVIVVEGASVTSSDENREGRRILDILLDELPSSQAVRLTAKITGAKKNALYELVNKGEDSADA